MKDSWKKDQISFENVESPVRGLSGSLESLIQDAILSNSKASVGWLKGSVQRTEPTDWCFHSRLVSKALRFNAEICINWINDCGLFLLAGCPMQGTLEGCLALAENSSSKSMASQMSIGAGEVKMTTYTTGKSINMPSFSFISALAKVP